jgi:PadR family transcriptional regulator, regulatory protein PadR
MLKFGACLKTLPYVDLLHEHQPRMSVPTLKVLGLLLSSGNDELSGAEIGRATKLASGTLYPILFRLEKAGWLQSRWEAGDTRALGRPRRRLYLVTPLGAQNAASAFKELEPALGKVAWT